MSHMKTGGRKMTRQREKRKKQCDKEKKVGRKARRGQSKSVQRKSREKNFSKMEEGG